MARHNSLLIEQRLKEEVDVKMGSVSVQTLSIGKRSLALSILIGIFLYSSPPHSAAADFTTRCQSPGVILCKGFDSTSDINPFIYTPGAGGIPPALDTSIKASGGGSVRFTIPPRTGADAAGSVRYLLGRDFGPGDTFYVQMRQRFSPEMIGTNFGGEGFKQIIFHNGPKTCADVELTTQAISARGSVSFPIMYTSCGSRSFYVDLGNGDWLLEQGSTSTTGFNCHYQNQNTTDCAYYKANQWITYSYEIHIGNWGQPNSVIKAWVGFEGQALKQFINYTTTLTNNNPPGAEYNAVTLLPYITQKDSSLNHPTAYTWYDELIVSTQPIPAPDGSPTPTDPPLNPPTGLRVVGQ